MVPVLTVGAADARQEMERLKQLLRRLGDGVADAKAANKITFSIGAAEMDDVFDFGHTLDGTGAAELAGVQRIVANFCALTSLCIAPLGQAAYDPWAILHLRSFCRGSPGRHSQQRVAPRWQEPRARGRLLCTLLLRR